MSDAELDRFKRDIRIVDMAAYLGCSKDVSRSTERSIVLRDGRDKFLVQPSPTGDLYCSITGGGGQGSVIDFVMNHQGLNLGEARKMLRSFSGSDKGGFPFPIARPFNPESSKIDPYRKSEEVWNHATQTTSVGYLHHRGLNAATLNDPRFTDTYRQGSNGTVIFPHYDDERMCGYEIRGHGVRAFGKGILKGLWRSNNVESASDMVICESVIDCYSRHQLYRDDAAYIAFSGGLSSKQVGLLTDALKAAVSRHQRVIIATDNDTQGHKYFEQFQAMVPDYRIDRHKPIGSDWNADLQYCLHENPDMD